MTFGNQQVRREAADGIHGEVYEAADGFWAEVILVQDDLDWVTAKSPDFSSRAEAVRWLAKRNVQLPPTVAEALIERLRTSAVASLWKKLGEAVGYGNSAAPSLS